MTEFWEEAFKNKQEMWGKTPTRSAKISAELFAQNGLKNILIPGIGYGRNASAFLNKGMTVTGIEISETAIDLAKISFGPGLKIYHGSVSDMPFDSLNYDGIYCHALIHLLSKEDRKKLLSDCFNQLLPKGMMVFTAISKEASTYGQGKEISKDRFQQFGGVNMFFYDKRSIQEEFDEFGLETINTVEENYPFYLIQCRRSS